MVGGDFTSPKTLGELTFGATISGMRRIQLDGIKLPRMPAVHVSRTPPPYPPPRERVSIVNTRIPSTSESPALNMGMLLPVDERTFPRFAKLGSGLEWPYYPHPRVDLLIPSHYLYSEWLRSVLSVVLFLTPSDIGLPYSWKVCRRTALRYIASVYDRQKLITDLLTIRYSLDFLVRDIQAQRRIAYGLRLPSVIENRVLSELSSGKTVFSPMCVEWLLAEAIAAPPPPWGLLPKLEGSDELEQFLFPTLTHDHPPTERQLLRAILLAQEGYFHDKGSPSASSTESLLTEVTAGMLETSDLDPLQHLATSAYLWEQESDDVKVKNHWRDSMLNTFVENTGITYPRFLGLVLLECITLRNQVSSISTKLSNIGQLDVTAVRKGFTSKELHSFEMLVKDHMTVSIPDLSSRLHDAIGYQGWGSLPSKPLIHVDCPPFLDINGELIPLGYGRLVRRARTVILTILERFAYKQPRSLYGKACFEAMVLDLAAQLRPRYHIATDSDIERVVGKSHPKPDLVLALDRSVLVVEVFASEIGDGVRTGKLSAIIGRNSRYVHKRHQAVAIEPDVPRIARELFNWSTVTDISHLVVVEEVTPNNPVLEAILKDRGRETGKIVCSIDEFLSLVALAVRGWSVPEMVRSWQSSPEPISLGCVSTTLPSYQ